MTKVLAVFATMIALSSYLAASGPTETGLPVRAGCNGSSAEAGAVCPRVQSGPAEQEKKSFLIPRLAGRINVDGVLDEAIWSQSLKINLDIEVMPGENVKPPVETECLLGYDRDNLYVGFIAYDPEPNKIRATLSDRDQCWGDDTVGILLDTFNDQNRAFSFFVNPLGIQADEIMSLGGVQEDMSWDAIWNSAGKITETGYSVEIAIPFRSLQFQRAGTGVNGSDGQVWGFIPVRSLPRSRRHQISCIPIDRNNPCTLCQAAKLAGFEGVSPGRSLEFDPTMTAGRTDARESFPDGAMKKAASNIEAGISGHWGFTRNLTLSFAANPDFSQVEADVAQLDINKQFALYYPEKRPFFLEGLDFFATSLQVLDTRSVADPDWGIKISGKQGRNAVGFFSAQDSLTNVVFPGAEASSSFSLSQRSWTNVLRYRRDIGKASTIGLILTDREGKSYLNRLGGLDGLIRFSKSDLLDFQVLGSSTRYPAETAAAFGQDTESFSGYAGRVELRREKRSYYLFGEYGLRSPGFRADLGYIPQVDFHRVEVGGGYIHWGKPGAFFNRLMLIANYDQTIRFDGGLLERELESALILEGPLWSQAQIGGGIRRKVYQGVEFDQKFASAFLSMRPSGTLNLTVYAAVSNAIDYDYVRPGKALEAGPEVELKLGRHLGLSLSHTLSRLDIDGDRLFLANLTQSKIIYHLNSRVFFRAILQYTDIDRNTDLYPDPVDAESRHLFSQLLFSYKLNPRTVLFVGYSDNHLGYDRLLEIGDPFQHIPLTRADRTFFLKIGYAWNL